jgi:hypothetical protein
MGAHGFQIAANVSHFAALHNRPPSCPRKGVTATKLVPLHRGDDGLKGWQASWVDKETDATSAACVATDEAFAFEGEHHLMDGRRSDREEALDVGFGRRPPEDERIGMNKGQVLALLVGKFLER